MRQVAGSLGQILLLSRPGFGMRANSPPGEIAGLLPALVMIKTFLPRATRQGGAPAEAGGDDSMVPRSIICVLLKPLIRSLPPDGSRDGPKPG